jgi:hypothetical protein
MPKNFLCFLALPERLKAEKRSAAPRARFNTIKTGGKTRKTAEK